MPRKKPAAPPNDGVETLRALHEVELAGLKGQLADQKERYRTLLVLLKETEAKFAELVGAREALAGVTPKKFTIKASGKIGEATAVAVASDWHVEERVDPATVHGKNEFSPAIAEQRVRKFFENLLKILGMVRKKDRVETLVLALLGDFITNTIHEDLAESNYMGPMEALLFAFRLLLGGIDLLLDQGGFKEILVPCNWGNHGRMTKKKRVNTAAATSLEWFMYRMLAMWYAKEPRLKFSVAPGYFNFLDIYGVRVRIHHGDWMEYRGGVGGIHIPLGKALSRWNEMEPADVDVLGHWHQRLAAKNYVCNGSLIGYSPFSIKIKAPFEKPQQSFFLVHPKYGKTVEAPIHLE